MSAFPGSPRLVKGGLVQLDRDSGAVLRTITLQYNPDTLNRTLQMQGVGDSGDRLEALRLKGPPVETVSLEAVIDAIDRMERPDVHPDVAETGIAPALAALETILYPAAAVLAEHHELAARGALEILPAKQPLTLFVWSASRIVPVRLTEFAIVEEAFDTNLNPIRAKVSLGMRVLSVNDLLYGSLGGSLYLVYQREKERLSGELRAGSLTDLGIGGVL